MQPHTQAEVAMADGEVPVGCVLIDASGSVVCAGRNETNASKNVRLLPLLAGGSQPLSHMV